jgi:gluconolactonase
MNVMREMESAAWLVAMMLGVVAASSSRAVAGDSIFENGSRPQIVLKSGAGEGPAWHPDYGLFFSGPEGITLMALSGETRLFLPKAGSNGLLFDHQGQLLICQPVYRRVSRFDVQTKTLQVLTDSYGGKRYNQPNDMTVDSKGRVYFSDPKYGPREGLEQFDGDGREIEGVYRIDPDRNVTRIIAHEVDRPNGVVVTPDDRYLFVADNNNNNVGAARKLWRFNLQPGGSVDLKSRKLIYDWKTGRGPDGMVLDQKGRLYVAGGLNKSNPPHETADEFKGGVYVFSPDGERLAFAPVPRDEVTNCTFGGSDLRTLYITAGGTLWSVRTTTPGQMPWPKPRPID